MDPMSWFWSCLPADYDRPAQAYADAADAFHTELSKLPEAVRPAQKAMGVPLVALPPSFYPRRNELIREAVPAPAGLQDLVTRLRDGAGDDVLRRTLAVLWERHRPARASQVARSKPPLGRASRVVSAKFLVDLDELDEYGLAEILGLVRDLAAELGRTDFLAYKPAEFSVSREAYLLGVWGWVYCFSMPLEIV